MPPLLLLLPLLVLLVLLLVLLTLPPPSPACATGASTPLMSCLGMRRCACRLCSGGMLPCRCWTC